MYNLGQTQGRQQGAFPRPPRNIPNFDQTNSTWVHMLPTGVSAHLSPVTEKGLTAMACDALTTLPLELTTKILEELDWYSLMKVRKTCKYLYHVSKLPSVWRSQLRRYREHHKYSFRMESPLDAYSALDLERWVTQRISADAGWKSNKTKPTRTRYIRDHTTSAVCLVPGGRWLLVGSEDGSVTAYDLDLSTLDGTLLLQLPDHQEINHICIDIDEDSPNLAFTMALSPGQDPDSERVLSIHVWAVTLVGHGREAYLKASPLRSFQAHLAAKVANLTLHRHLVGRLVRTSDRVFRIEIFDWTKSTSSLHCKTVISCRDDLVSDDDSLALHGSNAPQDSLRLLPGNRVLAFSGLFFMIYEVVPAVHKEHSFPSALAQTIEPSWKLPCPHKNRTRSGGISPAFTDANATYFTFFAGSAVHGLVIPHNTQERPRTSELAQFTGPRFPDLALGFEKMFAHHYREAAVRLGFAWEDDKHTGEADPGYSVKAREYSRDWDIVCPPVLDEGSGRIVQSLINGVLVMDTALCSMELVDN